MWRGVLQFGNASASTSTSNKLQANAPEMAAVARLGDVSTLVTPSSALQASTNSDTTWGRLLRRSGGVPTLITVFRPPSKFCVLLDQSRRHGLPNREALYALPCTEAARANGPCSARSDGIQAASC